jgi:hypothetical protein
MHSQGLSREALDITWGRGDHAELFGTFQIGEREHVRPRLKDWAIATQEFMTEAQEVVKDTLLDHDRTFRCKSYIDDLETMSRIWM